jgi:Tfp pilus assembly protein PilE
VKKKLFKKLSDRYRLIIYNDTTFQSVWSMKLTRLKVFTLTSLLSALIVVLVILLIATTGLREYIPGYPRAEYRQVMVQNALKLDSGYADTFIGLGTIYEKLGDAEKSKKMFEKARKLNPKSIEDTTEGDDKRGKSI